MEREVVLHRPAQCVDEMDVPLFIAHGDLREGVDQQVLVDLHGDVALTRITLLFGLQFKHLKRAVAEALNELVDATLAVGRGLDLCTTIGIRFLLTPGLLKAAETSKIGLGDLLLLVRRRHAGIRRADALLVRPRRPSPW